MTTFWLYDRWGNQLRAVSDVLSAVYERTINGDWTLTMECVGQSVSKGQRVVFLDRNEVWREQIVRSVKEERYDDGVISTVYCEDSLSELYGDFVSDIRDSGTAMRLLQEVLEDSSSRWQVGLVTVKGDRRMVLYRSSARVCLDKIVSEFGAELSSTIEVSGSKVTARKVNLEPSMGSDSGKRFSYRKDLISVERTVSTKDVCTALYGYGKSATGEDDQLSEAGYQKKLDFSAVNDGKEYVEDLEALELYGRPDGHGGKAHVFGKVEFNDCEDMLQLKELTEEQLALRSKPQVSYVCDVLSLKQAGYTHEGTGLGDTVSIVDETFDPPLRLRGRVLSMKEDLLDPSGDEITLGNIVDGIDVSLGNIEDALGSLQDSSGQWDAAGSVTSAYLDAVIKKLNEQFNAGGSFCHTSFDNGTIWASVPLDENGKATKVPATAIQLCSSGFRIASSVDENGEWDWRTFGTGEGFTANELNVGVIKGGSNYWNLETGDMLFKQGGIHDVDENNYWNLDTGEFRLSPGNTVGDVELGGLAVSTDVEYGLSDSEDEEPTVWGTDARWERGKALWTRTKLTLVDGSTEYTEASVIAGVYGIGLVSAKEQYYLSTSKTSQDGGSWSYKQPSWVKDKYYWTRTELTWSDGSVTYSDPVLAAALTSGNQSTDDLDDALTQEDIFNRLTNNGQEQGIYLQDGKVYLNGTYIKAGTVATDKIYSISRPDNYVKIVNDGDMNGVSFNWEGEGTYLNIEASGAYSHEPEPGGVIMSTFGKPFFAAQTNSGAFISMGPPKPTLRDPYSDPGMSLSDEQIYIMAKSRYGSDEAELDIVAGTSLNIQLDSTHYLFMRNDDAYVRCGNKGFGIYNGVFRDDLTFQ